MIAQNLSDARRLLDSPEVAEYLKVTVRTLDTWAYRGTGPRYSKVGRHRRYRLSDIDAWLDEQSKVAA